MWNRIIAATVAAFFLSAKTEATRGFRKFTARVMIIVGCMFAIFILNLLVGIFVLAAVLFK